MKPLNHYLTDLLNWFHVRHEDDPPAETTAPVGVALLACFASLALTYWLTRSLVTQLSVWWIQLWVYALVPVAVTFIILYRSCWHPKITGAARTCSLLLLSCAIFAGTLLAIGLLLAVGCLFVSVLQPNFGP